MKKITSQTRRRSCVFAVGSCFELIDDFRMVLRDQTRSDHDRLDQLVGSLDISQRSGFTAFAEMHLSCFLAMQSRQSEDSNSVQTLQDMIDGLRKDLLVITDRETVTRSELTHTVAPLAIDYIVAGSRLGSKVLRKRWSKSTDASVQGASVYFQQDADPKLWPETCASLSEVASTSLQAATIVKDTKTLFQLFSTAFDTAVLTQDAAR